MTFQHKCCLGLFASAIILISIPSFANPFGDAAKTLNKVSDSLDKSAEAAAKKHNEIQVPDIDAEKKRKEKEKEKETNAKVSQVQANMAAQIKSAELAKQALKEKSKGIKAPQFNVPQVKTPQVKAPKVKDPNLIVPEIKKPKVLTN